MAPCAQCSHLPISFSFPFSSSSNLPPWARTRTVITNKPRFFCYASSCVLPSRLPFGDLSPALTQPHAFLFFCSGGAYQTLRLWDLASARSWLQDTLKRKLVDFTWNRRFFFTRRVLAFFRVNPAKSFNQPNFQSGALVFINRRVILG